MKSFLVVGGGLVGSASALRLQRAGFDVTLVDQGDPRRAASFGNIGCIAAEQVQPWSSYDYAKQFPQRLFGFGGALDFRLSDAGLWLPWALRYLAACDPSQYARGEAALTILLREALPAWKRIAELAGASTIMRACGHAVVWMNPRAADAGIGAWRRISTGSAKLRDLSQEELDRYTPLLRATPAAGIAFTGTGQVSEPQAARDALQAAFTAAGGKVVHARIAEARADSDGVRARIAQDGDDRAWPTQLGATGEYLSADAVLIAAGAWSNTLMHSLGAEAPVIAERGYSVQSPEHNWPDDLQPAVFEERSMVVSRFLSGLRASSFLEFGSPNAPGDARKWARLQQHLRELGIAFSATPDVWVGPRPTLPDYVPAIGRLQRSPNVFYAFGHQHLGLTMSAVTAEIIEALATGNETIDLHPMRIERFA